MRPLFLFLAAMGSSLALMHLLVDPDQVRCVGQELDEEDYAVFSMGAVHARKDTSHTKQTVVAIVRDPQGKVVINEKLKLGGKAREEQLNIKERGVYEMCFELHDGALSVALITRYNNINSTLQEMRQRE